MKKDSYKIRNSIKITDLVKYKESEYVVIYKDTYYMQHSKTHGLCIGIVEIGKNKGKIRDVMELKGINIEKLEILALK